MIRPLAACLALFALVLVPASLAEAGGTKEFSSQGFKWTLPDEWKFVAVSPQEQSAGFITKAECETASIEVWVYVASTDNLELSARVQEVVSGGSDGMGVVSQRKVLDSTLSGVDGKVVIQKVKADGGTVGHFRTWVISSGGKFYQLILRAWHDSQESEAESINALRAGFRLLKGAGGKDKPESMTELDADKPSGNDAGGQSGGGNNGGGNSGGGQNGGGQNGGSDPDWPPGSAKREGQTIYLPTHNVEWTLPKGPFQWIRAPTAEKEKQGCFAVAKATVAREVKQEFQKDRPASVVFMEFYVEDVWAGLRVNDWVKGNPTPGVGLKSAQEHVKLWKIFETASTSKSRTWDDAKIGNWTGAILKMEGKDKGNHEMFMLFTCVLRDKWYRVHFKGFGATDIFDHMKRDIGAAVAGMKFLDTTQLTRGPLLGAIPDFAWHRGEDADKEREFRGPGFTFKKPKGMAHVKVRDRLNRDIRFCGEMRNKEGDAYLYIEIRTYKLHIPNTPDPQPEKFVGERVEDWSAGAGSTADVGRSRGDVGQKGSFGRAKGLAYEFEGDLDGTPFVEEGWVVKHKHNLIWIKMQLGGEDADKKLKREYKKVKRAVKFSK